MTKKRKKKDIKKIDSVDRNKKSTIKKIYIRVSCKILKDL